uniref:AP-3 complex subunit beta-2-like n=1 Tax=Monopterus albus TaxID=43700 RepID=UPI0009B38B4C|nr:AP-3 complex subunit beta-2-like [Monopterus albus]
MWFKNHNKYVLCPQKFFNGSILTSPPCCVIENVLQLVAGSVVMAFEEVCLERIDLIHKNYRKLCNLLINVEEWGQAVVINVLTRYARNQFLNPNINESLLEEGGSGEKTFYGSAEDEEEKEKKRLLPWPRGIHT